jgi:hypothetical protein
MRWDKKKREISTFHHFQYLDGWRVSFVFLWMFFVQQFVREKDDGMLFK